jgi:hypothetical protein
MLNYITRGQAEATPAEDLTTWCFIFHIKQRRKKSTLNEVLEMGPNLLPDIFTILLRFRLHFAAIISDITQAFLQLALDERDRDLTRFSWYRITQDSEGHYHTTDEIITYCFTRLPFGLTCSPFLLSTALREHAERHKGTFPHSSATCRQ